MKKILLLGITLILVACGSSSQKQSNTSSDKLNTMIENKSFEIKSRWAIPQLTSAMQQLSNAGLFPNGSSSGSIDISSHTNFLKMENDSVKAQLPFYGERQFGGGYGTAGGIEFEDVPKNLQISEGSKGGYEISFSINDKNTNTENYKVFIKLHSDLSSTININSSSRSNIQYRGKVYKLDK